ncbi:type VI secretion system protein TssA [Parasedimentitalea maritima]|uniref:Type VI secretion system protein TssA n=1 Tax=Parasedimentitalea maritima TaxID=2578117 RepID=A0A5R8ZAV0_9RHOB|nr:type VI secretion system protein TssA [Zongyanglinia marina]KAE9629228.1 type VI secretion system protein TssA [Zongyanglinia marina]TLP62614.1 type VI secretion system protein TssA [Zongyanglinia marina]
MDPTVLLQSKEDGAPSGENLEYDPTFTDMELAALPGEEIVLGDTTTEASDPDYREVQKNALLVLERSHDIRAAVFLSDAILHSEGLTGFADATTFLRGCLEQYWETCHPELDEDDGDPTMRINAVQDLCGQPDDMAGPSPVYRSLRRAPLSDSRGFGRFSLRDIEVAEGVVPAPSNMESVPDTATVSAAFQDSDDAELALRVEAIDTSTANVKAISAAFDEHTPGQGPDLNPLVKLLQQMGKRLREYASMEEAETDEGAETEGAEAGSEAPVAMAASGGGTTGINSPSDVSNALDRIIGYYRRAEPSSPVPVLLERAKRLVGADFLAIITDMAPQGISNVHLIGGIDDDD